MVFVHDLGGFPYTSQRMLLTRSLGFHILCEGFMVSIFFYIDPRFHFHGVNTFCIGHALVFHWDATQLQRGAPKDSTSMVFMHRATGTLHNSIGFLHILQGTLLHISLDVHILCKVIATGTHKISIYSALGIL